MQKQYECSPVKNVPVQMMRIGNTAIAAVPGELFVEEQLRTKQALERGGYETRAANWSYLAPDTLLQIGDAALEMIRDICK